MSKAIKVTLLSGWSDYSRDNPEGPAIYLRDSSESPGPLQVSLILHKSGEFPNPSDEDLVAMAVGLGESFGTDYIEATGSGDCALGRFGTAVFSGDALGRAQAWYLSNGRDFLLATHIGSASPDPQELQEVEEIVRNLMIIDKPWWRFW